MRFLYIALQKGSAVKLTGLQLLLFILSPLYMVGGTDSAQRLIAALCSLWKAHLCTFSPCWRRKHKLEPYGVHGEREAWEGYPVSSFL